MFDLPPSDRPFSLVDEMFTASLPETTCHACSRRIGRRKHRMSLRASWRGAPEALCPECWTIICRWAARFALQQLPLPLP